MSSIERIHQLVNDKVSSLGFELFDLKVIPAGSNKIVRIYIDSPQGVTIGDCESVSSDVGMLFEVENIFNRAYTLEVSSPGIDRPLRSENDYERNIGRLVKLALKEKINNKKSITGKIIQFKNKSVHLVIKDEEVEIPLSNIETAKIELEFK